jgi:hypothetical protein
MILAACEAESFLLFFSRFFRPQICLAPQHEKIAFSGNVFVLWGASLITVGVQV